MNKQDFIEKILNSTVGVTQVIPDDTLFDRIQIKIEQEKSKTSPTLWLVAASILILLSINISILTTSTIRSNATSDVSQLVSTTDNQLY